MKRIVFVSIPLLLAAQVAQAASQNHARYRLDPYDPFYYYQGSETVLKGDPGPQYAELEVDFRGYQQVYGHGGFNQGDPSDSPYASDVVWAYASAHANWGVLKAAAVVNFDSAGGPQGESSVATAWSRDTFTIDDPLLNGMSGTLDLAVFLSGSVRGSNAGSDAALTEPGAGASVSVQQMNSQGHFIGDSIVSAASGIIGAGPTTTSVVRGDSGAFEFIYGQPFTLQTTLSASVRADPQKTGPNGWGVDADVAQSMAADFGSTAYLGFVLPDGAVLSADSEYGYFNATSYAELEAMIPTPVPLPAAAWFFVSGAGLLLSRLRRRSV